jgi:hypothetical protein
MSKSAYSLPATAGPKLEALVDRIQANPGDIIDVKALKERSVELDIRKTVALLPEGFKEDDLVGMLMLAMLTESATDSYAAVFLEGADTYDAPWLRRFSEKVWVPDEHTHYAPYKYMLQSLGFSEDELDREIRDAQARHYEHSCGITPVELTTFGTVQEFLTDHWHGLLANLLKEGAPYAAHCANLVKRRETLHTVWYRDMTALLVEENPEHITLVAKALASFQMPGTSLVPEYGGRSLEWMQRLNVDFAHIARELVRNFSEAAGTVKRTGQVMVDMAVTRNYPIGPFPARFVRAAMDRLGGPGYGIIGEAILMKVGLPVPSKWSDKSDSGLRFHRGIYETIRSKMRNFVADRIDVRSITGDTSKSAA